MNKPNKGPAPRSATRNAELRLVLDLLSEKPNQSIGDVGDALGYTKAKARNDFMILEGQGFIWPTGNRVPTTRLYSIKTVSPEMLDEFLPITRSQPIRDPLTAMLMGGHRAPAPSLNFTDSIHGV